MTPMQPVFDSLMAEADREAAALVEAATAEAVLITESAAVELEDRRRSVIARQESPARALAGERLAEARREAAARILHARHSLVERVLRLAVDRSSRDPELLGPAVVTRLAGEALPFFDRGERLELRCHPASALALREMLGSRLESVVTDGAMSPGVILRSAGGRLEVGNTIASRVDQVRDRMAAEIIARVELP
jgi:vacuolar-type H+-ATPase subunit E/Vma4